MQIIGKQVIDHACKKHSEWSASMRSWTKIVENAQWRNFVDVKNTIRTADKVGQYVIFDIAHNRARPISLVDYDDQQVIVTEILTHSDYNGKDFAK